MLLEDLWFALRPAGPAARTQLDRVRRYYEQCDLHYRLICQDRESQAMHYGVWDEGVETHRQAVLRMNALLARAVSLGRGDRVLDAGCGVGGSSFWMARHCGASVDGVSIVPLQIRRAEANARARGLGDLCRFHVKSYDDTGFADATFDVCWMLESLCHSDRKDAVLGECMRVLRPGGRLVVADGMRARRDLLPAQEQRLRKFLDTWVIADLLTPEELSACAEAVGFQVRGQRDLSSEVLPDARWLRDLAKPALPIARAFDRLGLIHAAQLENVEAALLQHDTLVEGLWGYGLMWAAKPT